MTRRFGMAPRPLFAVVLLMMLAIAAGKNSTAEPHGTPAGAALPPTNCPPEGRGGDPGLNVQKNRTTATGGLLDVTFDNIVALNAKAVNKKLRANWTDSELQSIRGVEDGNRVEVAGIILNATLSGAETCNCSQPASSDRDFHIWIVRDRRNATTSKSFVVEMTPRVRVQHPGWTL